MKRKKTGQMSLEILVSVGLLLIIFAVIWWIFIKKPAETSNEFFNTQSAQLKTDVCKMQGIRGTAEGISFKDRDSDKYPDSCDICIGGDNKIDGDLDGMPDACDNEPEKKPTKQITFQKMCEDSKVGGKWVESAITAGAEKSTSGQCVLRKYWTQLGITN
jgi:cytoskeletal protein RodZ